MEIAEEFHEILEDDELRRELQRVEGDNTTDVRFTNEQIIKEMDEYVAKLIASWETSTETRFQKDRDAEVWDYKEANSDWREKQIAAHDRSLKRSEGKLQDLRRAILKESYTQATEVKFQCGNLAGQLKLYWRAKRSIDILKSNNRPVVIGPDVELAKRQHPPADSPSEEELNSDSNSDFESDAEINGWFNSKTSREQDDTDVSLAVGQAGDSYSSEDDVTSPESQIQPMTPDDTDDSRTPQRQPRLRGPRSQTKSMRSGRSGRIGNAPGRQKTVSRYRYVGARLKNFTEQAVALTIVLQGCSEDIYV
jgi:hypothetical protein